MLAECGNDDYVCSHILEKKKIQQKKIASITLLFNKPKFRLALCWDCYINASPAIGELIESKTETEKENSNAVESC